MRSENSTGATDGSAQSARGKAGDLRTRFLSALVLGPLVLLAVFLGDWVFQILIFVFAVAAAVEWARLVEPVNAVVPVGLSAAVVAAILIIEALWGVGMALAAVAVLTPALFGLVFAVGARHRRLLAFGIPYVSLGSLSLIWLRDRGDTGLGLLIFLLFAIWATDIGAYAAGRSIGGPKLAPRISPGKTWAGLLGGMAGAALCGGLLALAFGAGFMLAASVGAGIAVVSQLGDLFESALKRRAGVKDSGHLIPGHGGLLDRIDGLVFAAPLFAFIIWLTLVGATP
jgi:phosphatidate cytidylyltransferase